MHKKYKNAKDLSHKNRSKTSLQMGQKYKLRDDEIEVLLANFDKNNKQVEKIFVNNKLKYAKNPENRSERMPSPKDFKIKMRSHDAEREREKERSYRVKERDREKDQRKEKEHRAREREKIKQWEKVKNDRGDKEHKYRETKPEKDSPKQYVEKLSKPKSNHKLALKTNESFSEYSFENMNFFKKQKLPEEFIHNSKKAEHKHKSHKHEIEIQMQMNEAEAKKRSKEEKLLKRLRKLKEMRETGFHLDEQNLVFMQHHQQLHKNQPKGLDNANAKSRAKMLEESKSSVNLSPYEKYVLLENPELANFAEKRRARRKKQRERKGEATAEDHHPVKEKKKVKPNLSELIAPREESVEKIPIKEPTKSQNKAFVDEEFKKYLSTIHKIIDKRLEQMILKNQIIQPTNNEIPVVKPCKSKKSDSDLESSKLKSFKEEFFSALAEGDQPASTPSRPQSIAKPTKRSDYKSDFIVNKVEAAPMQSIFADYKAVKTPNINNNENVNSKVKIKKSSEAIGEPHQVHICQRPERRENSFVIEGIEPAKLSNQNKMSRKMFLECKTLNIIEIASTSTNYNDNNGNIGSTHVEYEELIERKKKTRLFKNYYDYFGDSSNQKRSKTDLETTFSDCNKHYMGSTDTLDTFPGDCKRFPVECEYEPTKDTNSVKLHCDGSNDSFTFDSNAYQNFLKPSKRKNLPCAITHLNNIVEEPSNISMGSEMMKVKTPISNRTVGTYFETENDNYKKRLSSNRQQLNQNDNKLLSRNTETDQNPMIYLTECGDSRKLIRIASDSSLHILKRPAFSLSVSTCNETPIISKEQISYSSEHCQAPLYKSECIEVDFPELKTKEESCQKLTSKSDVQLKKSKIPKSTQSSKPATCNKKNIAIETHKSVTKINEPKSANDTKQISKPAKKIAKPNSGVQTIQRTKFIKTKEDSEVVVEKPLPQLDVEEKLPHQPNPIEKSTVVDSSVKSKSPPHPSSPVPKEKKTYTQQLQQRGILQPHTKQKTMLIKSKSNIHESYRKKSEEKCVEPEIAPIENAKDPKLSKSKSEMNIRLKSAGGDEVVDAKKVTTSNEKWDKSLIPDLNHTSTFLLTKDYKKSEMSSYERRRAYDDEIRKKMRRRKFRRFEPQYNIEVRYCTIEKNENSFDSRNSNDTRSLGKKRQQPLAVHYRRISDKQRDEAIACKLIESPNSKKAEEKKYYLTKNSNNFKQTFPMLFANSTTSISDFTDISLDQTKFMEEILENSKILKERYDSIFNFEPQQFQFDAVPFSNEEIDANLMNCVCKAIEQIDDFMEAPPLKKRACASTASSTVTSMEDIAMNLYNYNYKHKMPSIRWTDIENTTDATEGTSDNNEVLSRRRDILADNKCLEMFTTPLKLMEKFSCPELNSLSTSFEFLYEVQSNEESDIVMPLHQTSVKIEDVLRLAKDPVDTKSRNSSVESGYASVKSRKCKSLHNFFKRPTIAALFRTNSTVEKVKKDESDIEDVLFFRYNPSNNGNASHSKSNMYERMTKECQSYAQKIREHGQRRSEGIEQEEYKEIPLGVLLGKETKTILHNIEEDINTGGSTASNDNDNELRIIPSSSTAISYQEAIERQRQQELSQKLKERALQRPFTPCSTIGTATEDLICSSVDVEDSLIVESEEPVHDVKKDADVEENIRSRIHLAKSSADTRLVRSEPFTVSDYKQLVKNDLSLKPIEDEANLTLTKIPSEEECVLVNDNGAGFSLFKHSSVEQKDRISPHAADKNFFESLLSVYEKEIELTMRLSQDENFYKNVLLASISKKLNGKTEKKRFKNFFKRKHKAIPEDIEDMDSLSDVLNINNNSDVESKRSYVNYHQLQLLACNAKRHFSLLAQAVMSNRGLTDEIKVCGFLKLLDRIEKGDFTVLRREEEVNFEDEIKEQIKQSFCKVYRICLTAAKKNKRKVTQNELNLLRLLVSKYRLGVLSQTDILAGYIGRGAICTENQLKAAITFLIRSNDKNMNMVEFEEFCNLNLNEKKIK